MAAKAQDLHANRAVSTAVDPVFYRTVYPETVASGLDPLRHYLQGGWREGRDPAPWFSNRGYLTAHADVAATGLEPLGHYLTCGAREGREIRPSEHAQAYLNRYRGWVAPWSFEGLMAGLEQPPTAATAAADYALVAPEFDAEFYLAANTDVAAARTDPLAHFMENGWREGRDPAPGFSPAAYLDANPDVAALGINPFVHYLREGRREGRRVREALGFRYDIVAHTMPPPERLAHAKRHAAAAPAGTASTLIDNIRTVQAELRDVHVTFSHDDYLASVGGLQLSVRRESAGFAELGADHLHLHPSTAWQTVRRADEPGPLGVILNGTRLGAYPAAEVRKALAALYRPGGRRSFAIHSLLGHAPEETVAILKALELGEGFFWLHDFASLCAGFHLLRDDVEDCSAPASTSAACGICGYGPLRARHVEAHRRLFQRLRLTVVAPAETTLRFWQASTRLKPAGAIVLPHARLVARGPAPAPRRQALRVAFTGLPAPLKGWPIFKALAERFADDPRYEFHHLGARRDPVARAAFHRVTSGPERPEAMRQTLAELEVDVALIWPLCRETFSLTAYEAAAAGAAVVTGPDSGNVAAFVAETGLGQVLPTEEALAAAFEDGAILELARARRGAVLHDLKFSALTADLLAEAVPA